MRAGRAARSILELAFVQIAIVLDARDAQPLHSAAIDGPLLELLDGSALEELGVGSGLDRARLLTARVRSISFAASRCKLLARGIA